MTEDAALDIPGELTPVLPKDWEEEIHSWEEEWQRYIELGRPIRKEGYDVYDKISTGWSICGCTW